MYSRTENPDVSIIVPVYKVEEFIHKCVDSLLCQTHKNIEIILVDDGSPDRCGVICDEYAASDNRVKVIHKSNGGLSDARNAGTKEALGDYIYYVDSDDYIEHDAVEKLLIKALESHADIVVADFIVENGRISRTKGFPTEFIGNKSGVDFLVEAISTKTYRAPVWMRLYKASFIHEHNLYFKYGILHEDEQWSPYVFLKARKVAYLSFAPYHHYLRTGSITQTTIKHKHIRDVVDLCNEHVENIKNSSLTRRQKYIIQDYFSRLYMHTATYGSFDREFYREHTERAFGLKNAYFIASRLQGLVYAASPFLYRKIKSCKKD